MHSLIKGKHGKDFYIHITAVNPKTREIRDEYTTLITISGCQFDYLTELLLWTEEGYETVILKNVTIISWITK